MICPSCDGDGMIEAYLAADVLATVICTDCKATGLAARRAQAVRDAHEGAEYDEERAGRS